MDALSSAFTAHTMTRSVSRENGRALGNVVKKLRNHSEIRYTQVLTSLILKMKDIGMSAKNLRTSVKSLFACETANHSKWDRGDFC